MLAPGEEGVVAQVGGTTETAERLMEMGLIAGTPVKVVKRAPLGDPIEIAARGYHLTVRKTEAIEIVLE